MQTKNNLPCRMYPVVSINARIIAEKNVSIGGYEFPKKVGLLLTIVRLFVSAFCINLIRHIYDAWI